MQQKIEHLRPNNIDHADKKYAPLYTPIRDTAAPTFHCYIKLSSCGLMCQNLAPS
jgi:hypothetical protein